MLAGIDLSSFFVDVVRIDEEHPKIVLWDRVSLGKDGQAFDRARNVMGRMWSHHTDDEGLELPFALRDCSAIGIEDPRGMNPGPTFRIQGAVMQAFSPTQLVTPWIPSQWRKAVGLKGNATKDDIMAHVKAKLGSIAADWPQDACDAWCVAEATRLAITKG